MVLTKKDRRHSGRKIYYSEADDEGYVTMFTTYDDWKNYRDGRRNIKELERKLKDKKKNVSKISNKKLQRRKTKYGVKW